jgi:hypothetical protein
MTDIKEKYSQHYSKFMGSYTFDIEELTEEIINDFDGWKVTTYQGKTIFYLD